jgi:hypothetical protein
VAERDYSPGRLLAIRHSSQPEGKNDIELSPNSNRLSLIEELKDVDSLHLSEKLSKVGAAGQSDL